jgi:SpoVK/Ycf46/Vps4 family AAA+-type ATPase
MYNAFIQSIDSDMYEKEYDIQFSVLPEKKEQKRYIEISCHIKTVKDIIDMIEEYPLQDNITYNINMKLIHDMKEGLEELNDFIGLENIKKELVHQIIYCVQDMKGKDEYMHMMLSGPPGTGKTELAKTIGKIMSVLLGKNKTIFKKATRSDLIAGYLGQTAMKTRKTVEEALGGVLFIDEAYALGHYQRDDSFAKECIDTLNEMLSLHRDDLIVIIAGYEDQLKNCFFRMNAGLESRFPWKYNIPKYTFLELSNIFISKIANCGWLTDISKEKIEEWFKKNEKEFPFYGRDVEVLLHKCKIAHSSHVFGNNKREKRKLIMEDIKEGFRMLKEHRNKDEEEGEEKDESHKFSMYT